MKSWVWAGALLLFAGFAHGSAPHHHAGDSHSPSPCPICVTGSAHFVAAPAPSASLLSPPDSPALVLREAAPTCASQSSPHSLRAPPAAILR